MDWKRQTAVAGRFYSSEPATLEAQLRGWFSGMRAPEKQKVALLAPHAGYQYSGKTAASAYADSTIPESVVILCPNHTGEGPRLSIWDRGQWETPLGPVAIDEELATKLTTAAPVLRSDRSAHLYEHAIEVHLPFLRFLNPKVKIVPIVIGPLLLTRALATGMDIGNVLSMEEKAPLIVTSTDMSHYISAQEAEKLDRLALDRVEALDPAGLYQTVSENNISMCGFIPTTIALQAAAALGASRCRLIEYTNSGAETGDYDSVVGYAAASID
ncbi:MAG: AmmeMemoRadiSam system protein B [Bdellovibrionaceae bacterium]|nr:AmmeMemoRadiSam system protein B [Bdellovibrionales bacterium]MCB9253757.1 AmmeMemoRadiSam system protein B [Pseudobdellovibrionaceae bacterium]